MNKHVIHVSWLPYSTYLYLDFHLLYCVVFHDKAEITQQGNLLDPHEHVDDPRVHALSNMLFQIQISPGPIFIKKQIQTRFLRKKDTIGCSYTTWNRIGGGH